MMVKQYQTERQTNTEAMRIPHTEELSAISRRAVPDEWSTYLPAIEMTDLCMTFGTSKAIDHLSLSIRRGEIFGLLGPNGSGKTTTINMISGLARPTSGMVRVLGHDVQREPTQVKRVLGCVPQETALYEELSAQDNMEYHAALYHVPRGERRERIAAMFNLVHLYEKRRHLVRTFSGGMKRRLALARAMLHEPEVLYLDEPTLGVDVQNRHALYEFILQLPQRKGTTILLTTNDMHEAEQLCSRVAILDHGTLQAVDTPQNLVRQSHVGETVIDIVLDATQNSETIAHWVRQMPAIKGVKQEDEHLSLISLRGQEVLADIFKCISQYGRTVKTIDLREVELEEVFLQMTGTLLRD